MGGGHFSVPSKYLDTEVPVLFVNRQKKSIFQQKCMDGSMCLPMQASVFSHSYMEATDELEIHVRINPNEKGR